MMKNLRRLLIVIFFSTQLFSTEFPDPNCLRMVKSLVMQTGALVLLNNAKQSFEIVYNLDRSQRSLDDCSMVLFDNGAYCTCLGLFFLKGSCANCCIMTGFLSLATSLVIKQPTAQNLFMNIEENPE